MKNSRLSFWLLIILGSLGVLASILTFLKGADFSIYFLPGFSGIVLMGTALINQKKNNNKV